MIENSDYIEMYLAGQMDASEKEKFERRLQTDEDFAEDVAFYLSCLAMGREDMKEEKKQRFREIYHENKGEMKGELVPMRWLKPAMAIAAILLVVLLGWTLFLKSPSPQKLATQYIQTELSQVGVQMGAHENELQEAKKLYNEGKFAESNTILEKILQSDPDQSEALKMAGLNSLRTENYQQALDYFKRLANLDLQANPGEFYQALTLMKRNEAGDKEKAGELLQDVIDHNQQGKETAREWLGSLK